MSGEVSFSTHRSLLPRPDQPCFPGCYVGPGHILHLRILRRKTLAPMIAPLQDICWHCKENHVTFTAVTPCTWFCWSSCFYPVWTLMTMTIRTGWITKKCFSSWNLCLLLYKIRASTIVWSRRQVCEASNWSWGCQEYPRITSTNNVQRGFRSLKEHSFLPRKWSTTSSRMPIGVCTKFAWTVAMSPLLIAYRVGRSLQLGDDIFYDQIH